MSESNQKMQKIWKVRPEWPFLLFLVLSVVSYLGLILLMLGANVLSVSWSEVGRVLEDPAIQHSIKLTFATCTATAILSVLVAVPVGYLLSRYRFRGRALLDTLIDVPILLPPLVVGLSLLILFNRVSLSEAAWVLAGGLFLGAVLSFMGSERRGRVVPAVLGSLAILATLAAMFWRGATGSLEDAMGELGVPMTFHPLGVVLAQFPVAAAFAIRTMRTSFDQISPRYEEVAIFLNHGCDCGIDLAFGEGFFRERRFAVSGFLRLEKLAVRVGAFELRDFSLEIAEGECLSLMGPSGCGKTTVMEVICGLREAWRQAGKIYLGGEDVTNLAAGGRGVGLVPQDVVLFPTMTVREHLAFGPRLHGWKRKAMGERVESLAVGLGLEDLLERLPKGLSGGESRRVALMIRAMIEREKVTTLHVTHSIVEARALGDRVLEMV